MANRHNPHIQKLFGDFNIFLRVQRVLGQKLEETAIVWEGMQTCFEVVEQSALKKFVLFFPSLIIINKVNLPLLESGGKSLHRP